MYLFNRVINILPEPKVFGNVPWNQMVLWDKREKSTSTVRISTVTRFDIQIS